MSLFKLITAPLRAASAALDATGISDVAAVFTEDDGPRGRSARARGPSTMDVVLAASTESHYQRLIAFAGLGVTCAAANGRIAESQRYRLESDMRYADRLFNAAVDEEIERRKTASKPTEQEAANGVES